MGHPQAPKVQITEEEHTDTKQKTTETPEIVVENQDTESSEEDASDEKVAELENVIEMIRSNANSDHWSNMKINYRPKSQKTELSEDISPYNSPDPAEATSSDESKEGLHSVPEGSFFNLATFLPFRLMETGSKAATAGSDTPRLEDSASSKVSRRSSDPDAPTGSSYYIFDPNLPTTAYYLYQDSVNGASATTRYTIDKVTLSVTPVKTGGVVYQVVASPKDQATINLIAQEDQVSHEPHDIENDVPLSPASSAINTTGSVRIHRLSDDFREEEQQSIVSRVIDRLRVRRHTQDEENVFDDSGEHFQETQGMYLVSDEDIFKVVQAVLEEFQQLDERSRSERNGSCADFQKPSKPKLDDVANIIVPPSATIAEPATTISTPSTAYTSVSPQDGRVHTKIRGHGLETTTRVVSRNSIAEISWTREPASGERTTGHESSKAQNESVSQCSSSTHRASTSYSISRRQTHPNYSMASFSVHKYTMSPNGPDTGEGTRTQSQDSGCLTGSAITSFPKLPSRPTTNDWMNPPVTLHELTRTNSLYHEGVDAHCGDVADLPVPFLEEPLKTPPCNRSLFDKNPFSAPSDQRGEGDVSEIRSLLAVEKKLGAALGSSSHRRRSSQQGDHFLVPESDEGFFPNLIGKIRQGSHKLFHRHHSKGSEKGEDSMPPKEEILFIGKPRKAGSPISPKPELSDYHAAILEISRALTNRKRGDTCSEDNRPHTCEDDAERPSLPLRLY